MKIPDPSPSILIKLHLYAMFVWALLIVPTVIFWNQSILWVAFMSIWANFATHFSAWDAARAEQSAKEKN